MLALLYRLNRRRRVTAARRHDEQIAAGTIGPHQRRQYAATLFRGFQHHRTCAVAKQNARAAILPVGDAAQRLAADHQDDFVPAALDDLVFACLANNPEDRPDSAEEIATQLASIEFAKEWTDEEARDWWQENLQHVKGKTFPMQ